MKIIKHIVGYLGSSVAAKGLVVLAVPILANILPQEDYGALVLVNTLASILASIIAFALSLNITRLFHVSDVVRANVVASIIIMSSLFVILSVAIFGAFEFTDWHLLSFEPGLAIFVVPLIAFSQALFLFNLNIVRCQERIRKYIVLEMSYSFGLLLMSIGAVSLFEDWRWYFLGGAIFSFAATTYSVLALREFVGGRFSRAFRRGAIRQCLVISAPVFPHVFASLVILYTDRVLLDGFFGTTAVAVYAVGYTFGSMLNFYTDAFVKMWGPRFFALMHDGAVVKRILIARVIALFSVSAGIAFVGIAIVSCIAIPLLFDPEYLSAIEVAIVVAAAYLAHSFYKCFMLFLVHVERTAFISYSSFAAAAVNLCGGLLLIPEYGVSGAAYASVLAYVISSILVAMYAHRRVSLPWKSILDFSSFPIRRADFE